MTHVIIMRLKNTSTVLRFHKDFPSKEAALKLIQKRYTFFRKSSTKILSVQRY